MLSDLELLCESDLALTVVAGRIATWAPDLASPKSVGRIYRVNRVNNKHCRRFAKAI
jgi:hypothetical protein